MGFAVVREDIDAIIVSTETLLTTKMLNSIRKEKGKEMLLLGLKPLKILIVTRNNVSLLSSTFIRSMRAMDLFSSQDF